MPYGVIDSKIQTGLPTLPDDNIPQSLYGTFLYVYQAIQNLQRGISQYAGIDPPPSEDWSQVSFADTLLQGNLTRMYVPATVAIARGQTVNLFNNAGTLGARLAVATAMSTMAHGVANTAAAPGQIVELNFMRATLNSIGGMTVGARYYLSTTPGAVQSGAPVNPGEIVQVMGLAAESSTLLMEINLQPVQL